MEKSSKLRQANSKFKTLFLAFIFLTIGVYSCNDDDAVSDSIGEVSFGFSLNSEGGRLAEEENLTKIIYSLEDENGETVTEDAIVNISIFDGVYTSDPVSLKVGNYSIIKFFVIGENDEVLYVTPLEESELAYLVENPLPIDFSVEKDLEVKVSPEVISTDEGNEIDFGYGEYGFNIVGTFDLLIAAFTYDSDSEQYELSDASLEISSNGEIVFEKELLAATNKVILSERFDSLVLTVTKDGYHSYEQGFTLDSLKQYDGTTVEGSLEVVLDSLNDGLVAFYPFNGDANDESGYANDGIVNGAVLTTDRNGNANSAYSFDGVDDYIDLDLLVDDVANSSEGTLSYWIKPADATPETTTHPLTFGDTDGYTYLTTLFFTDGDRGKVRINQRLNGNYLFVAEADYELSSVEWNHLVFVQDGTEPLVYINGELMELVFIFDNDRTTWFDDIATIDNSRMGYLDQNNKKQGYFQGELDDIRIYNRALLEEEIMSLYNE